MGVMSSVTAAAPNEQQPARWHVRSGTLDRGHFLWETIVTNYFLGRLKAADEVSLDQQQWYRLETLVDCPAPLAQVANDAQSTTVAAKSPPSDNIPRVASHVARRRAQSDRVWAELRERTPLSPQLALLVVLSVFIVIVGIAALTRATPAVLINCEQAVARGAKLDFCAKAGLSAPGRDMSGLSARNTTLTGALMERANLREADLSYAELTGADLSLADLSHARLLGATLRRASLGHAQLREADLRYADLRDAHLIGANFSGARLDHALWPDGRVCAPQSIGECH